MEHLARGLGGAVAVVLLVALLAYDEKREESEREFILNDPIEQAERVFRSGELFLVEIAEIREKKFEEGVFWSAPGTRLFDPSLIAKIPERKRLDITKGPIVNPVQVKLRQSASAFAAQFNSRLLELVNAPGICLIPPGLH